MPKCDVVDEANKKYKESNDWLASFLDECCIVGPLEHCAGGVLYKAYRAWTQEMGEYTRRNRDFGEALRGAGFECKHTKTGSDWSGLSLSPNREIGTTAEEDFLK